MKENYKNLENLLIEAKSVDSKTLVVDQGFKESLREQLYESYINSAQGGSFMAKLKSITLTWKVALASFAVLAFVALFAGGGVYLLTRKAKQEEQKEVLLAANLAVADGEVEVRKAGDDRWMEAKQGDTLSQGDTVKTGSESRAVLELDNGDAVRLNADSEVRLEGMNPSAVVFEQLRGESYSRVASSDENTYTIKSQGVEARAMGTAYKFSTNEEQKQVEVFVYESQVKLNIDETKVAELNKAIVNVENENVTVEEMTEEEFKEEFAEWNKEKDKEAGVQCHEENGPTVTITSPADGTETDGEAITVTGTVTDTESALRKIVVNGQIYTSKDENGKGFDPADGTFDVDVALVEGENTITVRAYDIYWNSTEVSVMVIRKSAQTPEPGPNSYFYVSSVSSPAAGKIYVKWAMSGYSAPSGFKAVAAVGKMPVYPGDKFAYVSSSGAREAYITGLPAGTYNVRVCIYNGNGQCIMYTTNYKTVTVEGEVKGEGTYPTAINISLEEPVCEGSTYKVTVNWSPVGSEAPNGYKVCWSTHANPTYPDDGCQYMSSGSRNFTVTGLASGTTYHFRVGAYRSGYCDPYSANVSKTMP
ncbi:FecR domain-containing protein [Candidatus Dojkabacteria bacterium]|nr:FecR domain-containing protein [Candidatus Dojkabacteria bacterium]